jgi:hypothetical protein
MYTNELSFIKVPENFYEKSKDMKLNAKEFPIIGKVIV